jgi:uncharacterized membrane protein (DUF373 family)
MKKIIIYVAVNLALIVFLIYMGYALSNTSFMQKSSLTLKMIFGLINYGFAILIAVELNRRVKQFLDRKLNSND